MLSGHTMGTVSIQTKVLLDTNRLSFLTISNRIPFSDLNEATGLVVVETIRSGSVSVWIKSNSTLRHALEEGAVQHVVVQFKSEFFDRSVGVVEFFDFQKLVQTKS